MTFAEALAGFLVAATNKVTVNDNELSKHAIQTMDGATYVRVVSVITAKGGTVVSRSAYCFIEKATGNVLKAASWKAPAKGTRSNIYAPDFGASGITEYGAVYHNR